MPKQLFKIENFEGGLNDLDDPRDINANELSALQNCTVSKGRIVMAGGGVNIPDHGDTTYPLTTGIIKGYGLFAFSTDRVPDANTVTATDALVVWDDGSKKFYWKVDADSTAWTEIVTSTSIALWNSTAKPCFFYLDGALRMSDGLITTDTPEPTLWWGFCKSDLFNGQGSYSAPDDWFNYDHDLRAPEDGKLFGNNKLKIGSASGSAENVIDTDNLDSAVNIWVRNDEAGLKKFAKDTNSVIVTDDSWTYTTPVTNIALGTDGLTKGWNSIETDETGTPVGTGIQTTKVVESSNHDGDMMWNSAEVWSAGGTRFWRYFTDHSLVDYNGDLLTFTFNDSLYMKFMTDGGLGAGATTALYQFGATTEYGVDYRNEYADRKFKLRVYPLGPELMVSDYADNRTFDNDTGNWGTLDASGADVAIANVSNKLQVTTTTDNEIEGARLEPAHVGNGSATSLVAGNVYRVAMELDVDAGTPSMIIGLGGTVSEAFTISTTATMYYVDILATNNTGALQIYNVSSTALVFTVDDVSVKESGMEAGANDHTPINYLEWDLPDPVAEDWENNKVVYWEFPYADAEGFGSYSKSSGFGSDFIIDRYEIQEGGAPFGSWGGTFALSSGVLFWSDPKIAESGLLFDDPVNSGPRKWGITYVYDGKQESAIKKFSSNVNLIDKEMAVGLTVLQNGLVGADSWGEQGSPTTDTNHRITGTNVYFYDKTDTPYRVAECDFRKGLKASTSTEFPLDGDPWSTISGNVRYTNTVFFSQMPAFGTYQSYNGFTADEEGGDYDGRNHFKASFANAAVAGRKLIVGPVYIDTGDGQGSTWHNDLVMKTNPGKYDQFPNKTGLIEVVKDDGDQIIALAIYADRLLQFKKKRMYLINISSSAEYLEDTFEGKGVEHPAAVFETDFGITWANNDGCYLYDGQKVFNLIESKISDSTWSGHFDSNTLVGYHSNSRKIIVTGGGTNNRHAYIFDLNLKSWSYHYEQFSNYPMTNFVRNADGDLVWGYQVADGLYKWSETAQSNAIVRIMTRDIDFENPGQRKNVYKVYLTFKGTGTHVQVFYGVDGLAPALKFNTINSDGSSTGSGNLAKCIPIAAGTNDWLKAELKPSADIRNISSFRLLIRGDDSLAINDNFEINDITIVYRLKHAL